MSKKVKVELPYGSNGLSFMIDEKNLIKIAKVDEQEKVADEIFEIKKAIENPIESKSLVEIAKGKKNAVIVVDDKTRPTPSYKIVPLIINKLHEGGIRDANIKIVVANGMHSATEVQEMVRLLGQDIVNNYEVINHDAFDKSQMVYFGDSKSGNPIWINKHVAEADIKILTGYIRPHPIYGFSGGRKSVVPGIADEETCKYTHRPEWQIYNQNCDNLIIKDNPSHLDALDISRKVGIDFIVNVVLNTRKEIVKVVAGDVEHAWMEGVKYINKAVLTEIDEAADVVISAPGNFPDDCNLYQAISAGIVSRKRPVFKKGASIIIVAECRDGIGSDSLYNNLKAINRLEEVIPRLDRGEIRKDSHLIYAYSYFATKNELDIYVVNDGVDDKALEEMFLKPCKTVEEALDKCYEKYGNNCRVLVVPFSKYSMISLKNKEEQQCTEY